MTLNTLTPEEVIEIAAKQFGYTSQDLEKFDRSRPLPQIRQSLFWILRFKHGLSCRVIGELFGGRNHTTVLKGSELIYDLTYNPSLESIHRTIMSAINSEAVTTAELRNECERLRAENQDLKRRLDFLASQLSLDALPL